MPVLVKKSHFPPKMATFLTCQDTVKKSPIALGLCTPLGPHVDMLQLQYHFCRVCFRRSMTSLKNTTRSSVNWWLACKGGVNWQSWAWTCVFLSHVDFSSILRQLKTAPKKHPKFCGLQLCITCTCMQQQSNLKGIENCSCTQFYNQNAACVACACMRDHTCMHAIAHGTRLKNPGFFDVDFCLCMHARSCGTRSKWNKSKHWKILDFLDVRNSADVVDAHACKWCTCTCCLWMAFSYACIVQRGAFF